MLDMDPPEDRHTAYRFTPRGEWLQHATLTQPPEEGGPIDTLSGHGSRTAPPNSGTRMRHTQQFCP